MDCEGGFDVKELQSGKVLRFKEAVKISPESQVFRLPVRVTSRVKGRFLTVNTLRYRGALIIRKASKGGVHVIDDIELDDYVKGILPREAGAGWPSEALKSQAVASRTFALRSLGRHASEGYDLCSTVHCQVFGGLESEDERTNRAVADTHNEILLYKGNPAGTFFFSNCGGRTLDPVDVWERSENVPYLRSIRCDFCRSAPHHFWENTVSAEDIAAALIRARIVVVPPLKSIRVSAGNVLIRYGTGQVKLRAARFRAMLGANIIRSAHIDKVKRSGGGFVFSGRGWGHGVGMCQEGAKGKAEKGAGYAKILKFYYPGAKLEKF
ncbi:MAG: hypothetical protein A3A86_02300 [Elusimicrobia bacterium RIFCSPLOWO2_01_FULL_60_11]|nr:MAG: hypothetical protein A3A86_02300 [Elusimicrobia bacterium RIFCSPLOWO2_01_FULL_60_11]